MERTHDKESRRVSSFGAAMEKVERQIDLEALRDEPGGELFNEIGRVMADVYARGEDQYTLIDGAMVNFRYMGEVFENITEDHVRFVADQIRNYERDIRFKKAFIRTALYNSVFELHTDVANKIRNLAGK